MQHDPGRCFALPAKAVGPLLARPVGKLTPVAAAAQDAVPCTFYDTFDGALAKAGLLLIAAQDRLELWGHDGTLRSQTATRTGQFVADLAPGPVREALHMVPALRALMPLRAGQMRGDTLALVDDEQKTQARAHLCVLTTDAAPGKKGIALAVLRGLRGYDKALDRLTDRLHDCGAAPWTASEVIARLFPEHVPYRAKPKVSLDAGMPAHHAATALIAAHLPVARRNETGIIADIDTEFLHDYRVALRKIRSVLSLFRGVYAPAVTADLKARFRALMAPTGRLRDLDVHLLDRDATYDLVPDSLHGGLDRMFAIYAQERTDAHMRLSRHLRSRVHGKEMDKLGALFADPGRLDPGPQADTPAHDLARALIWKRYRKVCKLAGRIGDDTPDEDVHDLRIQCKKLRYLMAFFAPTFPPGQVKALVAPLKRLQDNLGLFNDYAVQQADLHAFLNDHTDGLDSAARLELAQAAGALIAVLHQRQAAERARVVASFAAFNSAETQQRFRDLFHGKGAKT